MFPIIWLLNIVFNNNLGTAGIGIGIGFGVSFGICGGLFGYAIKKSKDNKK